MCTVITVDQSINKQSVIERIISDSMSNSDGFAMLMIQLDGTPLFIQSMNTDPIIGLIEIMDYKRIFIHTRYATQGIAALHNTHGWNHNGTYVFHNGSIRSKISERFSVDSEAIRYWLEFYGIDETIDKLHDEPFANVFLVNTVDGNYIVHRSMTGSLFTDGNGNYSTHAFDAITTPVAEYTVTDHDLDLSKPTEYRWDSWDFNSRWDSDDYLNGWDTHKEAK